MGAWFFNFCSFFGFGWVFFSPILVEKFSVEKEPLMLKLHSFGIAGRKTGNVTTVKERLRAHFLMGLIAAGAVAFTS